MNYNFKETIICPECGHECYESKQKGTEVYEIGEVIVYVCFNCQVIREITIDGESVQDG